MNKFGIYIHIPFCRRICNYCDFTKRVSNQKNIDKYVDYLIKEIELYEKQGIDFSQVYTIYIGGGTPSSIGLYNLEKIFKKLLNLLNFNNIIEFTIEINPEDLSEELIQLLVKYNVNRVSIGIQTFDNKLLTLLNRSLNVDEFEKNYNKLKIVIPNINLDLMYAIPGQTIDQLKETLDKIKVLQPTHVSLYSLILEENTVFYHLYKTNKIKLIDEELEKEMYDFIHNAFHNQYTQYEVSNYSKKGFESKHNLIYWNNECYLGFGLSAASFFENHRYKNTANLNEYFSLIDTEKFPIVEKDFISVEEAKKYHLILGFRLLKGFNLSKYFACYKTNLLVDFPILNELINQGYFEIVDDYIRIKQEYIYVMDHFLEKII